MIRRAWGSRHFANVVALMALFAVLGGQAVGQGGVGNNEDKQHQRALAKQAEALQKALLEGFKKKGGQLTSEMIKNKTLDSKDVKTDTLTSKNIKKETLVADDIKKQTLNGDLMAPQTLNGNHLKPETLGEEQIGPQAITGPKIKHESIGEEQIKPQSISGPLIKPEAIGGSQIAPQAITATQIKPETIGAPQIAPQAITATQIKPATIDEPLIKPNTITSTVINEQEVRGIEKCSGGLLGPFGDVCTTPLQTAGNWSAAELACDGMGMRLPTITEGLRALSSFSEVQSIWTDEIWGAGDQFGVMRRQAAVDGGGILLEGHAHNDSIQFRCVLKSSSNT